MENKPLFERDILLFKVTPETLLKESGEYMKIAGAMGMPVWFVAGEPPQDAHSMPGIAVKKIEYEGGFGLAIWIDDGGAAWGKPLNERKVA